jgi:branched-chain amino acid transport system permease protein
VAVAFALVLVVLAGLPFVPDIPFYYLQVVLLFFWYAALGTAWTIVGGYGNLFSLGHAAFVGLGAYTSSLLYLRLGVTPWIGLLIGMLVAAAAAVLIGYPAFRFGLRGDFFALATVAFGEVTFEIVNGWSGFTGGSQGIPIPFKGDAPALFQFQDRRYYYFVAMALWVLVVLVAARLRRSRLGYRLVALRDDEAAAARAGIDVTRTKTLTFALSAALAAALGTLYAQFYLFVEPASLMSLNLSIQIIVVAVVGGAPSFLGPTVGAALLVPLGQFLTTTFGSKSGADLAVYGLLIVLQTLFMPSGILGLLRHAPHWRKAIGW